MLLAERNDLNPVRVLISKEDFHLELFENSNGNLFLSSTCIKPSGTIYFAVTTLMLCRFLENKIDLQTLFNESRSRLAEISSKDCTALYSLQDIEVQLMYGNKKMKQLIDYCPLEIW